MDPRGDRGSPPLVEEPRRPPWRWIVAVGAALAVLVWIASNIRIVVLPDAPEPPPAAEAPPVDAPREAAPPPTANGTSRPRWLRSPRPDYPDSGLAAGSGTVVLNCVVQGDRSLGDCRIVEEDPAGYGFARSALTAAHKARVTEDSPVGVPVQFTIRYRLSGPFGVRQAK